VYGARNETAAVNLVKAELQVCLNITESCAELANFLNMNSLGKVLVKVLERKNIIGKKLAILLPPQIFTSF
jgi:hypothetical protein